MVQMPWKTTEGHQKKRENTVFYRFNMILLLVTYSELSRVSDIFAHKNIAALYTTAKIQR